MQPYVFPYIGYFQLIRDVDLFVIFDDVNYRKRSWISRNRILLNNADYLFTLHLSEVSSLKKINQIEVGANRPALLKTFCQAYSHAPYYRKAMPVVAELLLYEEKQLALYLMYQLQEVSRYLGLHTRFILSSDIEKNNDLKGQKKILAICEALGADAYSNAIGGQHLYFEQDFAARGIDLKFIQSGHVRYRQFNADFVPGLSIIDVMMFNSPAVIRNMLDEYLRIPAPDPRLINH